MNSCAKFDLTRDYYHQAYSEWIRRVSKVNRWLLPLGAAMAVWGGFWRFVLHHHGAAPYVLILAGLGQFLIRPIGKWKWMRDRLKEKITGEAIEIVFSETGVSIRNSFSESECRWEAFHHFVTTPNGMFLYPQRKMWIYARLLQLVFETCTIPATYKGAKGPWHYTSPCLGSPGWALPGRLGGDLSHRRRQRHTGCPEHSAAGAARLGA